MRPRSCGDLSPAECHINTYFDAVGRTNPLLLAFSDDWGNYRETAKIAAGAIFAGYESTLGQARTLLLGEGHQEYQAVEKDLTALVAFNAQQIRAAHSALATSNAASVRTFIIGAIAVSLLIAFLAWFVIRSMLQQLSSVLRLIQAVQQRDFSARAQVAGRHEIATIAASFNTMLDRIVQLLHSEEARNQDLETEIQSLIEQVTPIGEGDLRVRADISNSLLGTLADVFNFVADQLASLVLRVQHSAQLTFASAEAQVRQAQHLAAASHQEARYLRQTVERIHQLAQAASQIAGLASEAKDAAAVTRQSARQGGQATIQVFQGVKGALKEIENISIQMKTLSHHSDEISEVVVIIEDVARQTNLLSVNAQIQAQSVSPEFAQGFLAVGEQIQRLAGKVEESVTHIKRLIGTVQGDVYGVNRASEQYALEQRKLAILAEQTGRALQHILEQIEKQTEAIEGISGVATWQVSHAEQTARDASRLSSMTDHMVQIATEQQQEARQLADNARDVSNSITAFKLPLDQLPVLPSATTPHILT